MVLLGWSYDSSPIDEGAGLTEVAEILAPALVSSFALVFLTSDPGWAEGKQTRLWHWKKSANAPWMERLKAWAFEKALMYSKSTETAPVVWTRSATDARRVFAPNLWCLGGQVVFLVRLSEDPPQLCRSFLKKIAKNLPGALRNLRENSQVQGLLLPGHDGDWARLFLFDDSDWLDLKRSLEDTANAQGVALQEIPAGQFFSHLAREGPSGEPA